ncbi:MAG TPA: DUF3313 domain-containing protein [Syntrophorhabdales bacterium]|nr:DUF3313 domain-containing protein [Syntrophorhabdales bacterium]
MKTVRIVLAIMIGFAFVASAGFAAEPKYSGFLGDLYKNLEPGPEGGAKMRWMKPGVMFGKYDKFMVDSVIFFFADDSAYKGIDPNDMKELADKFNQAIVAAFKDKYPIVVEPGPDVARLRIAITGVKGSRPGVSAVSSILPIGLAFSLVKKGATGSYSGSGTTSAELEFLDTTTNEPIAAAVDEQSAGFTDRFSKWESAEEAFKYWAQRIVGFIDNTRGMK